MKQLFIRLALCAALAGAPAMAIAQGQPVNANQGAAGVSPWLQNLTQVNSVTLLAGAGATAAGSPRFTIAQDVTTLAGSAPGTAGTASANVMTVQGIASMTPVQVSQATAASLNATVVSAAGSAIIGKVGVDQTTPGTTNNVTTDGVVDATTTTASASSATTVVSLSTTGFGSGSFQFTSLGTGNTISFEASNDNTNWLPLQIFVPSSNYALSTSISTASGLQIVFFSTGNVAYVRARISTYGSGTVTIVSLLKRVGSLFNGVQSVGNGLTVQGAAGGNALPTWNVGINNTITAASGNQANANAVATLAGVSNKTTYITGFQCTASGATTGLVVNATVAGVITGTMTYTFVFPATGVLVAATPLIVSFPSPIPASGTNTSIVVTLPAGGSGNTNAACNAQGYQM